MLLALERLPSEERVDFARLLATVAARIADRLEIDAVAVDERSGREFQDDISYLKSLDVSPPRGLFSWIRRRRGLLAFELSPENDDERALFVRFSPWSIGATAYDRDTTILAFNDGLLSCEIDRRLLDEPEVLQWLTNHSIEASNLLIDLD